MPLLSEEITCKQIMRVITLAFFDEKNILCVIVGGNRDFKVAVGPILNAMQWLLW